jgi:hypothetical protein
VGKEMRSTNVESGAELHFLFLFMETAHALVQLHVTQIKSGTLKTSACTYKFYWKRRFFDEALNTAMVKNS